MVPRGGRKRLKIISKPKIQEYLPTTFIITFQRIIEVVVGGVFCFDVVVECGEL